MNHGQQTAGMRGLVRYKIIWSCIKARHFKNKSNIVMLLMPLWMENFWIQRKLMMKKRKIFRLILAQTQASCVSLICRVRLMKVIRNQWSINQDIIAIEQMQAPLGKLTGTVQYVDLGIKIKKRRLIFQRWAIRTNLAQAYKVWLSAFLCLIHQHQPHHHQVVLIINLFWVPFAMTLLLIQV